MRTLCFLTHQEIFDRAVEHLGAQRGAALLPKGGGAYRSPCGGCPVGRFIRAIDYTTAMEGVPVRFGAGSPLLQGHWDQGSSKGFIAGQDQRVRRVHRGAI